MDDKLESFVTLLNKQRQMRPAAPEPVRAPSWTQRMFSKRPDAAAAPVIPQAAQESTHETPSDSPPIATPIVPPAEIATVAEPIAAEIVAAPAVAAEQCASAEAVTPAPDEAIAESAALVSEEAASLETSEAALAVQEIVSAVPADLPAAQAPALAEATATPVEVAAVAPILPEEIASATSAEVAVATSEAAAEIAIVAVAEPAAEPVPEARLVSEEAAAPVEAVTAAAPSSEEIASATKPEAALEIATVAEAEPIAEATAIVDETVAPVEAAAVAPVASEEISAASAEATPAEAEATPEIITVAAVEPVAEVTAIADETMAPVEAAAVAPVASEEISAASAEATPAEAEATPEIVTAAAAEPVVEVTAIADETMAPVEATAVARVAPEEISAASAEATPAVAEATPEIVTAAAAEPVAEATAIAGETVPSVDAAGVATIAPEETLPAVSAEAAVSASEPIPETAPVAAAEPVVEPITGAPSVAEAAAPVEATVTSAADIVAAPEAVPTAAAPAPEVPAPAPIPEAASPLIAAIFARIARPDSVSATIAHSAAAAMQPAEVPAVAETNPVEADAALVPAPVEPAPAEPVADAMRDPHDLLARFLAETDLAVAPAPEQVLAEAAAKLDEVLQAVAAESAATSADDDALAAETDEDGEPAVPLPVIADAVAAARASRGYLRYGLTAIAVVAGVVVVGGAYWSTQAPSITLAGATAPRSDRTAMNAAPAKPAVTPADRPAAAPSAPPKLVVTAKAGGDVRVPSGAGIPAVVATIFATLPRATTRGGLAVVEARPQPETARQGSTTALAQAPRQLAMLTPPPPEPPTPVTSSMAAPPLPAPPAPPAPAAARGPQPTWERNAMPAPPYSGKPQIAIVIDDLGIDRDRTQRSVGLDPAITLSFLAYASDLPTQTEAARRVGHELIVHVPMEPAIRPKYISQGTGGEAQAELLRRLRWDLSRFGGYVGVNNHMGSRLSADPQAMRTVIGELKARGLLFLDSRLDGNTIDVAQHEGVAAVGRDVLLDDDITAGSVSDRLAQVEKLARQHGTAIALGHPHDQTINALKLWIASLPAKGLQLVPLSAIVKDREQHVAGTGG